MYIKTNWYIPMMAVNVSCVHYNFKCQMTINGTNILSGEASPRPGEGCCGGGGNGFGSYFGGE